MQRKPIIPPVASSKWSLAVASLLLLAVIPCVGQAADPLKSDFENPPESARPRVWWHWMNGNIAKEGIKLDLEWMHRVGIAGYQNFDAALSTPQVVEKRLAYMTPEWKDAFKYAISLGDQLDMEMAIAGSPGWSESGGPWVPPSHAMKKYVWSETAVEGGKPFTGTIAHPPTSIGAFQNMVIREQFGRPEGPRPSEFYADAVVVAFNVPSIGSEKAPERAKITASGEGLDPAMLSDGDLEKTTHVPIPAPGSESWIQFEYPSPQTIRAVTYVTKDPGMIEELIAGMAAPEKTLEASDDGQNFRKVANLSGGRAPEHTISFLPVTAKYFRVTFKRTPPPPRPAWAEGIDPSSFGIGRLPAPPTFYEVSELVLHPDPRVNRFEEKAAFVPDGDLYQYATATVGATDAIKMSDVVDLTSKMQPDGTLDWTPPEGKWIVLHIGYSLLGIMNHPATPEATGLEVDKLDRRFVKDYFEKYLDSYKETVGPDQMGKRGIRYVINDSWEAGSQNWTDNMLAQFKRLRGYDATPWLSGRIVASAEQSDRFLWDFRKTIADLIATEHYGQLEETLHERGMGHYVESHESGRAFVADGMEVKKFSDVPMSAMWTQRPAVNNIQYGYNADDRESASIAHIYGQNVAAAESMTAAAAPWGWSPATLKPTADQELLNGINRFVIHESAHQPLIGKAPGLTLGPFGQWFNRNETWAEEAGPWIDYLARSSYMLQQGHFGADLVYFYGEDSNLTEIFSHKAPDIPAGFGFDYINADALIHELSVADGRIVTKSGMEYKVLGLDPYSRHMSLPVFCTAILFLEAAHAIASGNRSEPPLNSALKASRWPAYWIASPSSPAMAPGVFCFRRELSLTTVPEHFWVHVSADNRFWLHVNGRYVAEGPARGDLFHWRFETVDLSPFLRPGRNVIAALVWNFAELAPVAQISSRTGFVLQGDTEAEAAINTGEQWSVRTEQGRAPLGHAGIHGYYAAGPAERIDGRTLDWTWDQGGNNASGWQSPQLLGHASAPEATDAANSWELMQNPLPAMERRLVDAGVPVRVDGLQSIPAFPASPLTVPAHSHVILLLDHRVLQTAYPELGLSGGRDAEVRLTYAEALYDEKGQKGNRDEIEGRHIEGITDEFISGGGESQIFTPLWWRTWRYLQIDVKTEGEPLRLDALRAWFTAYPFEARASISGDIPQLDKLWETGWRTARLNAHETYMDAPYWEQLQYVGDTRIQALISYAMSGDSRLAKQAITSIDNSRIPDGITQSRYPSSLPQFIPTFSLLWVNMLHDYWMYVDDPNLVKTTVPHTRTVLDWYASHLRPDGLLGKVNWWEFGDWTASYRFGVPPQDADGGSTFLTLQFLIALRDAGEMEAHYGSPERVALYRRIISNAADALNRRNWDPQHGLYSDTPAKNSWSHEANILAVMSGVAPAELQAPILRRLLAADIKKETNVGGVMVPPMSPPSYYFRFYLHQALERAGLGDSYLGQLTPWYHMLDLGLSTWAETPEPTRSDCHAWSASPNFDLLTIVAGIRPATIGFRSVDIKPHLQGLHDLEATMPHPRGLIHAKYHFANSQWIATITLPSGTAGVLSWKGRKLPLHSGTQALNLPRNE